MKWIAIDIGNSEIKVAVRGLNNKPAKLLYDNHGQKYSHLPSESYHIDEDYFYIGYYISIIGALYPDRIIDIKDKIKNEVLIKTLLDKIKQAAVFHYNDTSIGSLILYDDNKYNDYEPMIKIAELLFDDVKQVCSSEVLWSSKCKKLKNVMVIDITMSSLKVSYIENGIKTAYFLNKDLGFSSVDISQLIGYIPSNNSSMIELFLQGFFVEKARMDLCQGCMEDLLLEVLNIHNKDLSKIKAMFEDQMMKYLFKCFDICGQNLKKISKTWDDINGVIFCGGAANYHRLAETYNLYLNNNGFDVDKNNIITYNKDAQWAAVNAAVKQDYDVNLDFDIEF